MDLNNPQANVIKQVIDDLIQTATNYDTDVLERIYHDDLEVLMVDHEDNVNRANKAGFIDLFNGKKAAGDPPMNTWVKYHAIDVNDDNAHVLLSRKNDLSGTEMLLTLSIDLVQSGDRWQIRREVISLRPDAAN